MKAAMQGPVSLAAEIEREGLQCVLRSLGQTRGDISEKLRRLQQASQTLPGPFGRQLSDQIHDYIKEAKATAQGTVWVDQDGDTRLPATEDELNARLERAELRLRNVAALMEALP